MQAPCPNCQHTIRIDDAKVPERAFSVKCPKCQTVVKFPGKAAAAPAPAPAPPPPAPEPPAVAEAPPPPPAGVAPAPAVGLDEMKAQMMAQLRREMGAPAASGNAGRALVALPDRGQAGAITLTLNRLGYAVETLDDYDEGARLLEQGVYNMLVTSRQPLAGGKESLYQRLGRLQPEARRRVFVLLVGDEYKTGDGTQAFACYVDLVVSARDAGTCDALVRGVVGERQRMYQAFNEAKRRYDEG